MKKTEEKVIKFIAKHDLISRGDKILVSLSGGADSVFLLFFLNKHKEKYKSEIGAFHLNHMLRGKDADNDEKFCSELCRSYNIPFFSVRKNIKLLSKKNKVSFEEAGRDARYDELENISRKNGYNKIATAHNAGDNAETILLNLIKGTGLKGLGGIPVKRNNIIRPLLPLKKEQILKYLELKKINYRTDKSNEEPDFERNFIRLNIIPLVKEKLNPSLEDTLLSSSSILTDINSFIAKLVDKEIAGIKKDKLSLSIPLEIIRNFHEELRGFLIKTVIERNFIVTTTFNDISAILELVDNETGKYINISGGFICFRDRKHIFITEEEPESKEFLIKPGENVVINGYKISVNYSESSLFSGEKFKELISADNLADDVFILRNWKPGDRFFPIGMKGTKNVSDFLNNLKLEPSQKKKQLVLLNNNNIVWIVGQRIDNRFRITEKTKKVLELCLKKM